MCFGYLLNRIRPMLEALVDVFQFWGPSRIQTILVE